MKLKIPALHHHQASGRGRVSWEGRHIYFGKWDDPATHEAYRRWAAELITGEVHTPKPGTGMTVSELAVRYIEHCSGYYPPHSTMHGLVKNALDAVVALYGSLPLDEFGPKALRTVRGTWLKREHGKPLSRCSINKFVSIVKRMFRWATSQEFVDVTVYQALATLDNLKKGRSGARETKAIEPVSQRHIEAVLKIAPRIIRDMITVQMLCGARPGELCALKRGDIDTGGAVWIATLSEHKTAHIEGARARLIPFGPKCQAVLKPYMLRPMDAHIFDPRESVAERPAPKGRRRRPGQPENIRKTERTIRDHYDKDSYRRAVNRLCERAGIPVWSPNQLRKVAASRARERFGLDGAQVLLGHSSADVTQIYAKVDEARLVEIAKELG